LAKTITIRYKKYYGPTLTHQDKTAHQHIFLQSLLTAVIDSPGNLLYNDRKSIINSAVMALSQPFYPQYAYQALFPSNKAAKLTKPVIIEPGCSQY
jgi:hypothetical protein